MVKSPLHVNRRCGKGQPPLTPTVRSPLNRVTPATTRSSQGINSLATRTKPTFSGLFYLYDLRIDAIGRVC